MSGKKSKNPGSNSHVPRDFDEYSFIKETIKEKPVTINKKAFIRRIAGIAAGAVLFGVIGAWVSAGVSPMFESQKKPPKVDIDVEEPSGAAEPTPETAPYTLEVKKTITLEEYEQIYEEVRQVAAEPMRAMVTVTGVRKEGDLLNNSYMRLGKSAGVIIAQNSSEVYVLTQTSALGKKSKEVQVTFCDEYVAAGSLRKADNGTGFAVVAVPVKNLSEDTKNAILVATLGNSYSLIQGKPVIAIGSPSGYNETVAYGNITSVANKVSVVDAEYNLLVTDILGDQEGSGVLLDTSGSVIGIITQSFGKGTDTMVKALSVSQLKSLLAVLSNGEDLRYAGIFGQDVSESRAQQVSIPQGIYVDSVAPESPAMIAGIQSADVITEFNGRKVLTMQKFSTELQKCKVGDTVPIKLMRRGSEGFVAMEFEITISAK